ncbi:hypothetical protein J4G52_25095 [Burkholderia cenocepacia]|uniref:DUF7940 domain-containing protein n=1 Tax=Burkholderia cenocepacia TaxID=95486 RepID=UPI001AA0DF22|nr:hypothetical protein [Burkholderia cenocepacia]MBO1856819.1 hypothetical protein [Burkholderia cenocepacia]
MPPLPVRARLIDDWRHPLRFTSLHLSAFLAVVFGAGPILAQTWREIPDEWKALLPSGWAHWIATGGCVLIFLGHFVQLARVAQIEKETPQ